MTRLAPQLAIAGSVLLALTACNWWELDVDETTFTCDIGTACGEYEAIDAETANELKLQCGGTVTDGRTCSGYSECCYFEGETAVTWTYTNDPNAEAACTASDGDPC